MNSFALKDITSPKLFSQATYLDSHFILTAPEMPISMELIKIIDDWGFTELFSDGEARDYNKQKERQSAKKNKVDSNALNDEERVERAELFCTNFQNYVKNMFTLLPIKNELDYKNVAVRIKEVCIFVQENRRFLLRTKWLTSPEQTDIQLISHSVRSTIIAIIIGMTLKLQPHRLIDLGTGALLHEIGMIKLPQEIYQKNQALSDQERKLMSAHPILGFNLLKSFNFPVEICVTALEHHERENGTGYPQRKTGEKISLYSKIIAVACSYEAIISSRPHKGAKDGHAGILELLRNEGKRYDDGVVRALVQTLSIYPIGLHVLLSDGKKAQVVDVIPDNPRYPIVQLIGTLLPEEKNKTLQTAPEGPSIIRPLTRDEFAS